MYCICHGFKTLFSGDLVTMPRRVAQASQPARAAKMHPRTPPHTATAGKLARRT